MVRMKPLLLELLFEVRAVPPRANMMAVQSRFSVLMFGQLLATAIKPASVSL
jgi:hypothetical protein